VNGLAVTVDFKLEPGEMAAFRKLIDENAQMSCEREPGCGRFAVPVSKGASDRIFLYEIYHGRAAFDTHLEWPHFATFNKTGADLVMKENVAKFDLIFEESSNKR